jgi:hypothetical protein
VHVFLVSLIPCLSASRQVGAGHGTKNTKRKNNYIGQFSASFTADNFQTTEGRCAQWLTANLSNGGINVK